MRIPSEMMVRRSSVDIWLPVPSLFLAGVSDHSGIRQGKL